MNRHSWFAGRCRACGLERLTIRNGRGYPRTIYKRDQRQFRDTPPCDARLSMLGQLDLLEQNDCWTVALEKDAKRRAGISEAAPRQVIPGCKSQPGI